MSAPYSLFSSVCAVVEVKRRCIQVVGAVRINCCKDGTDWKIIENATSRGITMETVAAISASP